jgi:hypothetical protein
MAKQATKTARAGAQRSEESLVGRVKSDFPKHTLEEASKVAIALCGKNGGKPLPPVETAQALGISPGSSEFRVLLSSSIKYGLTSGSFNQERVSVEPLGRRIAEPTSPENKAAAVVSAALSSPTFRTIYDYYKGKKLPEQQFFENTIVREFNVPREHSARCVDIFTKNMAYAALLRQLPTGTWLTTAIDAPSTSATDLGNTEEMKSGEELDNGEPSFVPAPVAPLLVKPSATPANNKVFIAHGKNREVLQQLKDLLSFGGFEPVVSIEREATAEPVPQKFIGEMRLCSAAVINVARERELLDPDGTKHHVLNENVLIEIGAAMALYEKNFTLLVQKGVHMPSDLQGLYRCDYEGDKLDYEATMKLLKTFSLFRKK